MKTTDIWKVNILDILIRILIQTFVHIARLLYLTHCRHHWMHLPYKLLLTNLFNIDNTDSELNPLIFAWFRGFISDYLSMSKLTFNLQSDKFRNRKIYVSSPYTAVTFGTVICWIHFQIRCWPHYCFITHHNVYNSTFATIPFEIEFKICFFCRTNKRHSGSRYNRKFAAYVYWWRRYIYK